LQASAAVAGATVLPRIGWGGQRPGSFTFAYYSDTHVSLDRNIDENLEMVREIRQAVNPAFAVNGGDVTDYGWAGEFDNYDRVLEAGGYPAYHVAGNHDVRWSPKGVVIFRDRVGQEYSHFEQSGVHFLLLDSTVPLSHWGHYEKPQLEWLRATLDSIGRTAPVFVCSHHWVGRDRQMIDNEDELRRILAPYNVKTILTGHGHSDLLWEWEGMACVMNRGLYQGSYQRFEVDAEAEEVIIARRTTENPTLEPLTTISLRPTLDKRPNWSLGELAGRVEEPMPIDVESAREFRWLGFGPWARLDGDMAPTTGLKPGYYQLGLRAGENSRYVSVPVRLSAQNGDLREVWSVGLPGGVMSHVQLEGDEIFVSMMDGTVASYRADNGALNWSRRTEGYCHSTPRIENDTVYVGSADTKVHAFDRASGEERWATATDGPVYAGGALAKGVFVVGSGDGFFYGLDPETGEVRWKTKMPESNTAFAQSVATTDGERVFIGAWDSHLYAVAPEDGEILWRQPCQERTFAFSPAIGSPSVGMDRVFVVANGNGLFSFDAATGERHYEVSAPGDKYGHSSPRYHEGRIYAGGLGDAGLVHCADAETGDLIWSTPTGSVIYDSSPAVSDGNVSIGSVDGTLSVLDADSGALKHQFVLPTGHFLGSPAAGNGRIYAASFGNRLVALALPG
jgi:outer membrane protein assembly factor BamB/predicted phosphodiesterase